MAISGTTTNYTERKKDISILQYPDATLVDAQDVSPRFGKVGRFCAGVQKLIQRYTIILLTNLNSQENYPAFGTNFMYTLQAGISPTDRLQAAQIFNIASYNAVQLLKAHQQEYPDTPSDERIVSATLSNISLIGSSVGFDVSLKTEATDGIKFIIPLPK
jgi:hypothetical protein